MDISIFFRLCNLKFLTNFWIWGGALCAKIGCSNFWRQVSPVVNPNVPGFPGVKCFLDLEYGISLYFGVPTNRWLNLRFLYSNQIVYFLYGCMLQCEPTRPGYNALMNLYVRSKMSIDQIFSNCMLTTSNVKCVSLLWNIYQMDVDYIVGVNISDLNSKISPTCSTAVGTRSGRDVCRRRSWRE